MLQLPVALSAVDAVGTSWDFLAKGGIFMIPLGVASIVGLAAILYKFLALSRSRVIPEKLARDVENFHELLASERIEPVLKEIERGESTLARLASVVVKHRGKPQRDIILAVEASSRQESARLHAGIGVLDVVITVSPLLGLLGTASGLVAIFEGLSDSADHLAIARGIAIALNTTIVGLAIAVPCVVAHGYFTRRIEVLTARLESLLADLANVCQKARP
ncbi:MAG: MotA/TolQ/ExbB proton channel family protein [Verrucomicrobiota bacterium JB025]|nr:MotA/TolQ/ExbB proton channel family protein [Verrucomicrobiota bacterium JB025]